MNKTLQSALAVNLLTALLVFSCFKIFAYGSFDLNLLQGISAYSCIAVLLSKLFKLPVWWWFFNGFMPWALAMGMALALPPSLFLFAFIAFWLFYTGIGNTRVPYYPTQKTVRTTLQQQFPEHASSMLDIGSGFGGWCLALQKSHPDIQVTGVEMAFMPWLISVLRARLQNSPCRFVRGDYRQLHWSNYDVIYAYLSPVVMESVWQQACAQMQPGSSLISCEFDIASMPGQRISPSSAGGPDVFIWNMDHFINHKGVVAS